MESILIHCSIFSALIPISIGLWGRRKFKDITPKIILSLCIGSFAADFSANILARIVGHNYWIINLYFILELSLLAYLFYSSMLNKRLIEIIYGLFLIFILSSLFLNGINERPVFYRFAFTFSQIIIALVALHSIYKYESQLFIERYPLFWFIIGILVYFSGSFFTYLLSYEILSNPKLTWNLHNMSNIVKNGLFAIGLFVAMKDHDE